ncbi:DUF6892 domain-containing protein [Streptomyces vilmorinianum]|uniref:DUF6892 domain-containing protein n=1 Tax=Streptomyces vilmorinianum TaxID=3051092 RepID=UPI0010FB3130|nr:hypothetical protein [Streptomyces vilmorinianum]
MTDFRDFSFKLLVVEKLMYWDETLAPMFSLREHMQAHGVDDLDTLFTGGRALEHMLPGSLELLAARGIAARC